MDVSGSRGGERETVNGVDRQVGVVEIMVRAWIDDDVGGGSARFGCRDQIGTRGCSSPVISSSNENQKRQARLPDAGFERDATSRIEGDCLGKIRMTTRLMLRLDRVKDGRSAV